MKQLDPLTLESAGSLLRPGPVGRILRLILGSACIYGLYYLLVNRAATISNPVSMLPNLLVLGAIAFYIVNYVVNIGFGQSWGRWPSYVSATMIFTAMILGWLIYGTINNPLLGVCLWLWLVYFYAHLGGSFVLAALLATPGCEMRSIPELIGILTARKVQEHRCPVSLVTRIDRWESTIRNDKD